MFTGVDTDDSDEVEAEIEAGEPDRKPPRVLATRGHGRRALVIFVVPLIGLALVFFMVYLIKDLIDDGGDGTQTESSTQAGQTGPVQDPAPDGQDAEEKTLEVCVDVANLRAGPGTDHEIVGTVDRGDELLTTPSEADDWVQLVGSEAYISTTTLCD